MQAYGTVWFLGSLWGCSLWPAWLVLRSSRKKLASLRSPQSSLRTILAEVVLSVGVNMYTVCSLGGIKVEECIRESWAYVGALLALVVVLILVPQLSLALVGLMK
jgi:hypothetical protein